MKFGDRYNARQITLGIRQAPRPAVEIRMRFAGQGKLDESVPQGPLCLSIETTDEAGDLAAWYDNEWWSDVIGLWGDHPVKVQIDATPGAVLHPVVTHSMMMLRRVMPSWRLSAIVPPHCLHQDGALEELALSPYHEIRFITTRASVSSAEDPSDGLTLEEIFKQIRQIQNRENRTTPILVRLPAQETDTSQTMIGQSNEAPPIVESVLSTLPSGTPAKTESIYLSTT